MITQWGQKSNWSGQDREEMGRVDSKYLLYSAVCKAQQQAVGTEGSPEETFTLTGSGQGNGEKEVEGTYSPLAVGTSVRGHSGPGSRNCSH